MSRIDELRAQLFAEILRENPDFNPDEEVESDTDDGVEPTEATSADATGAGYAGSGRKRSRKRSKSRGRGLTGGRKKSTKKRSRSRGRGLTGGKRMSLGARVMKFALQNGVPAAAQYARSLKGGRRKRSRSRSKSRGRGLTGGRRRSSTKSNPWLVHMAKVRRQNPHLAQPQIAKLARRSYRAR